MVNLSDFILPHSDPHGAVIFQAVREGMWPFKAEGIYLYTEYDIDVNRYRLRAEVRFKNRWHLQHCELVDRDALLSDPTQEIAKLYPKFVQAFRNREDLYDLAPDIHLGEN